jgi:hypothetical protein
VIRELLSSIADKLSFIFPEKRIVRRGGKTYHMGPDVVICMESSPYHAVYETDGLTPEGWRLTITAERPDGQVFEDVGMKYAIKWGFMDDGEYA